jgi:glutathione S-transferase
MITIYNFPRGARGIRVFWTAEEMGLAYRAVPVSYPPPAAYLALNPLGNVPFLEDAGHVAINESVAMMLYLAERYGPTPLLPAKTDSAFSRVLQMTVFGEATLGAVMNPMMAARFAAPDGDKENWSVRNSAGRVEQALNYVATTMGAGPYIAGEVFTLADISIAGALDMWQGALRKPVPDVLMPWRERVQARPAYGRAQKALPA